MRSSSKGKPLHLEENALVFFPPRFVVSRLTFLFAKGKDEILHALRAYYITRLSRHIENPKR